MRGKSCNRAYFKGPINMRIDHDAKGRPIVHAICPGCGAEIVLRHCDWPEKWPDPGPKYGRWDLDCQKCTCCALPGKTCGWSISYGTYEEALSALIERAKNNQPKLFDDADKGA